MLASTALARGGTWRHIEDLGLGLQRAGLEVTIGLLPAAVALHRASERAGLRWEHLHRTLGRSIDLWHVHLHDTYDVRAFLALAARRPAGRSVITEHLPHSHASDERLEPQYPRTRYAREAKTAFKRTEFRLAAEVITVSAGASRFLEERYSLPAGTVTRVYNGVLAPDQPPALRPPDGRFRVVAIGSLDRQKGHDVLLEAARRSAQDWQVTVVGTGGQLESLRAAASGLAAGRVSFLGWVDDPGAHILAADVMCMPSRWESLGYAALEAGALCRPVVASRIDGLDEIIVDGESGVLVAPDDPGELAAALDRLATSPELVARYGRAAYARVREQFTMQGMVDGVLAAYGRACSEAAER
ncbi:MAG TPA: glycosyltransferase family 4 protein [Solirubrobacteraceae bacterium]